MKIYVTSLINCLVQILKTGMDCFTSCVMCSKTELNITIPYTSSDFLKIVDDSWFEKTHEQFFLNEMKKGDWVEISSLEPFDLILMSIRFY